LNHLHNPKDFLTPPKQKKERKKKNLVLNNPNKVEQYA
jgi:hypothetical protein